MANKYLWLLSFYIHVLCVVEFYQHTHMCTDTSRTLHGGDLNLQRYRTCLFIALWNIIAKHMISVLLLGHFFGTIDYNSNQPIVYIIKAAPIALVITKVLKTAAVQVSLLLRCGDIEMNPGPLTMEGEINDVAGMIFVIIVYLFYRA